MESKFVTDIPELEIGFHSKEVSREEDEGKVFCFNPQERTCTILTRDFLSIYNYHTHTTVCQVPFIQNKDNHVISICYSKKYELFFVYKENWTITLYSKNLKRLKTFHSKLFSGQNLMYLDDYEMILSRTVSNIRLYKVGFKNYTRSGAEEGLDFAVLEGEIKTWNNIDFIQGSYFFKKQKDINEDMLVIWGPTKVVMINIPSLIVKYAYYDSAGAEEIRNIVNVFYSPAINSLLIGYFNGLIQVRKVTDLKVSSEALVGHNRPIISFVQHPNPMWVLSASAEGHIIVWNIESLTQLMRFEVHPDAKIDALLAYNIFFYYYEGINYVGTISWQEEFLMPFPVSSAAFTKGENKSLSLKYPSLLQPPSLIQTELKPKTNDILFVMENNLCILLKEKDVLSSIESSTSESKLGGIYKPKTLYPPPKCSKIKQIEKCPYVEGHYYMLSSDGALIHYTTETEPPKLLNYYPYNYFLNEGKSNSYKISAIKFISFEGNRDDDEEKNLENQRGLLTVGNQEGFVSFLDIGNIKNIFVSLGLHKHEIVAIDGMTCDGMPILVTLCKEHLLKLTKLSKNNKAEPIKVIRTGANPIAMLKTYDNKLIVGTHNGNLGIFQLDKDEKQLYMFGKPRYLPDHSGDIDLLTILPLSKLILTYSKEDNYLKCWDFNSNCIMHVKISECFTLRGVECFGPREHLVLCYDYHVTTLDLLKYIDKEDLESVLLLSSERKLSFREDSENMAKAESFFAERAKNPKKLRRCHRILIDSTLAKGLEDLGLSPLPSISYQKRSKSVVPSKAASIDKKDSVNFTRMSSKPPEAQYLIRKVYMRQETQKSGVTKTSFSINGSPHSSITKGGGGINTAPTRVLDKIGTMGPTQLMNPSFVFSSQESSKLNEVLPKGKKPPSRSDAEQPNRLSLKAQFLKQITEKVTPRKPNDSSNVKYHRQKSILKSRARSYIAAENEVLNHSNDKAQ